MRADHYGVIRWNGSTGAVLGNAHPWDNGRWSVSDPRPLGLMGKDRNSYVNQAHYGVVSWAGTSNAVPAFAKNNNGAWSVGDPRFLMPAGPAPLTLPDPKDRLVAVIIAPDGTWHRPFTTLDLAALQSMIDPEEAFGFDLDGSSDSAKRERIGNAVPALSAKAIASVMGRTLLLAWSGESFFLSQDPIWVQPLTIALSVRTEDQPYFETPDFELVQ